MNNKNSDKKGLILSISSIGSIICLTAIIISLLSLFNVFDNEEDKLTQCPPNQCNIKSNNVSSTFLSCPTIQTSELENALSIRSNDIKLNDILVRSSTIIDNINNNVNFKNGLTINTKIDDKNITFTTISLPNISGTNISILSEINIKNGIITTSNLNCNKINFTDAKIQNLTSTNTTIIQGLKCNNISGNNFSFTNLNLKNDFFANKLSTTSIDAAKVNITNLTYSGKKYDYYYRSGILSISVKNLKTDDIFLNNSFTVAKSNLKIIDTLSGTFSNFSFSSMNSNNITSTNVINSLNIIGKGTISANKILSSPLITVDNLNFDNIVVNKYFKFKNVSVSQLSVTTVKAEEIRVDTLFVKNTKTINNLSVTLLNLNNQNSKVLNLTLTNSFTDLYIFESQGTLKMSINNMNNPVNFASSIFLTTNQENSNLNLKIIFRLTDRFFIDLFVGLSLQFLISTKRLSNNLKITIVNELLISSIYISSTEIISNNNYKEYRLGEYTGSNVQQAIINYFGNNVFSPINDTLLFKSNIKKVFDTSSQTTTNIIYCSLESLKY